MNVQKKVRIEMQTLSLVLLLLLLLTQDRERTEACRKVHIAGIVSVCIVLRTAYMHRIVKPNRDMFPVWHMLSSILKTYAYTALLQCDAPPYSLHCMSFIFNNLISQTNILIQ